jgi:hypothetical protein
MPDELPEGGIASSIHSRVAKAILDAVAHIPQTDERKSRTPGEEARRIVSTAAAKAALAAGTLAMPPGLVGMITVIPELLSIWRIQTKMVADIAAVYGQTSRLTREQMLYCLFKATAAQAVGVLVVTVGEGVLIRRSTLRFLQSVAARIGVKVTQKLVGRSIIRWLPLLGPLGVGAYAYYETGRVAQTAINLFEKNIEVEATVSEAKPRVRRKAPKKQPPQDSKTAKKTKTSKPKRRAVRKPSAASNG